MDSVSDLTDPLHAPLALLEPRRVPWQVDVDLSTQALKVEALAGGIGGANKSNVAVLDGRLDLLASGGTALGTR